MGWVEDMDSGWRVTTDATTLFGSVAWAALLPDNSNVCEPSGTSRVYALDFGTTKTILTSNALFESIGGNVTDLHFVSVAGKASLVAGYNKNDGSNSSGTTNIGINPLSGFNLRRLNWRELQTAD